MKADDQQPRMRRVGQGLSGCAGTEAMVLAISGRMVWGLFPSYILVKSMHSVEYRGEVL